MLFAKFFKQFFVVFEEKVLKKLYGYTKDDSNSETDSEDNALEIEAKPSCSSFLNTSTTSPSCVSANEEENVDKIFCVTLPENEVLQQLKLKAQLG